MNYQSISLLNAVCVLGISKYFKETQFGEVMGYICTETRASDSRVTASPIYHALN
jgi:hypothetical protein